MNKNTSTRQIEVRLKQHKKQIQEIESLIDYQFKNKMLVLNAVTHSSYVNESILTYENNERLEFLGDSILGFVVSEFIYSNFPHLSEGEMSRTRASVVCEMTLAERAMNLKLGTYLIMGKGQEITGGRSRISILADVFEAIIGAIYLDGGIEPCKGFIIKNLSNNAKIAAAHPIGKDYKTRLQEVIQKRNGSKVAYEIVNEFGPVHERTFVAEVRIGSNLEGTGQGRTKKEAEQEAAKVALLSYKEEV